VPHPELPKTFWTFGSIAQVRVPETPERVVACLVGAGERIDKTQLPQRRRLPRAIGSRSTECVASMLASQSCRTDIVQPSSEKATGRSSTSGVFSATDFRQFQQLSKLIQAIHMQADWIHRWRVILSQTINEKRETPGNSVP